MSPLSSPQDSAAAVARGAGQWLAGWWRTIHLAALLSVLALSPSSYRADNRRAMAKFIYLGTAQSLPWFTLLSLLISIVVIRIVLVTALSYGLTQYALEMVVRVLVLELIPLAAALFAALRCTMPLAEEVATLRTGGGWDALARDGVDPLRQEVLPRVVAGSFCALMLAAVSCVVTLVVAYLSVYGLTSAGFAAYTHTVGHVFSPAVSLILLLKILLLGLAVALMPIASVLDAVPRRRPNTSAELQGLIRMFMVIVIIEAASLVGNYY
jgi:phospholipid/cholesterol/gamma-HCH transport system permease protein